MRYVNRNWPLLVALGVLWALVAGLYQSSLRMGNGHFVYVLDDPYIHMAMARHFVEHGVLGVTADHFSAASSSVLWSVLLCLAYASTGVHDLTPLVINVLAASGLLLLAATLLRRSAIEGTMAALVLLALIFITPLPSTIFTGLEHVLHALLSVALVYLAERVLLEADPPRPAILAGLGLLAAATVAARYEGMFLVLAVCALLCMRRRFLAAALALGLAWLPVVGFGLYSLAHGSLFLPNSVLLKGQTPAFDSAESLLRALGFNAYQALAETPALLLLLLAALGLLFLLLRRRNTFWQPGALPLVLFVAVTLLHCQFARLGWFYRYEAYLIALGLLSGATALRVLASVGLRLPQTSTPTMAVLRAAFVLLLFAPLAERGFLSLTNTPQATRNIYEQHYQMTRFVKQFYNQRSIALHDVGMVGYSTDAHILDLWGLADVEVAQDFRNRRYNSARIGALARQRQVAIAMLSEEWLSQPGGPPPGWRKVGQWRMANNVVAFSNELAFYATSPEAARELSSNLRIFSPYLPSTIQQSGDYLSASADAAPLALPDP